MTSETPSYMLINIKHTTIFMHFYAFNIHLWIFKKFNSDEADHLTSPSTSQIWWGEYINTFLDFSVLTYIYDNFYKAISMVFDVIFLTDTKLEGKYLLVIFLFKNLPNFGAPTSQNKYCCFVHSLCMLVNYSSQIIVAFFSLFPCLLITALIKAW